MLLPKSGGVNSFMSSLCLAMDKRSVLPPMSDVVAGVVVGAVVGAVVGSGVIIAAAGHLANFGGTRGHSGPRRAAVGRRIFFLK